MEEEEEQDQERADKRSRHLNRVNQSVMDCVQRKFQTVGHAQLIENIMQVILYRLLADKKLLADFAVPEALRYQLHDFLLPVAQQRLFAALARFRGFLERV